MSIKKARTLKNTLRTGKSAGVTDLINASLRDQSKMGSLTADRELRKLSDGASFKAQPIKFGTPSDRRGSSSSSSGGVWQDLLQKSTSSGITDLVGGGIFGFAAKSLFSGFGALFGGSQSQPAPLTTFSLPDSIDRVVEVGSQSSLRMQSTNDRAGSATATYSDRNAEIVKAVREALLTSSRLNDVIAEL